MKHSYLQRHDMRIPHLFSLAVGALWAAAAWSQPAGCCELAAFQAAANATPGVRQSPAHATPNPENEVSLQTQAMIGAPDPPHFNADPKNAAEWKDLVNRCAALLCAKGKDLKAPQLSPIYGDFAHLPPTILTSDTRELFLFITVRSHLILRRAGVRADLPVYEGQSHAQYGFHAEAPETKEVLHRDRALFRPTPQKVIWNLCFTAHQRGHERMSAPEGGCCGWFVVPEQV
jgi:acetyl esterase/lipase